MAIYHVKKNGQPVRCRAFLRECPHGGPEAHYNSRVDALRSYELRKADTLGEKDKLDLIVVEKHDLRLIDTKLLASARKMAEASASEMLELQAITEPLAIIRAARVEAIMELSVPQLTPGLQREFSPDSLLEAPD